MVCAPHYARAQETKEYLVKAAFIYNFVKFVEWPGGKAIAQRSNIDVCVMGDSPLSGAGSVFKAASTPKLSLSLVKENDTQAAIGHCHVLFISESEAVRMRDLLAALKGRPVLTVSDVEGFAEKGGMIGFVMSDGKIKVVVNTHSATQSGMRVDAQLLEIALRVIDR
ncbi:MAG: YfiR family protein [Rickettsiales bacterium]|nr:YfiR family protein [Rickettsiales bacterium]